jgi:beta-lactamase class A
MSRRADVGKPGESALRSALEGLGNLCGCRVGVSTAGLEGPLAVVALGFGEDEAFPSASLIKVLVLAELLRQADSGSLSLAEEVLVGPGDLVEDSEMLEAGELPAPVSCRDLAGGMIAVSDNAATNLLIRRVGAGTSTPWPAGSGCGAPLCGAR